MHAVVVANNRFALWVSNLFSAVKILILLFIVVAGWVVLGGGTRVKDPHSHFKGGFSGSRFVQRGNMLGWIEG